MDTLSNLLHDIKSILEGNEGIYWAPSGFSRVRIAEITGDDWGIDVDVQLIPTSGLLNSRPESWNLRSRWDAVFCTPDLIDLAYIDESIFINPEVVNDVLALCAGLREPYCQATTMKIWQLLKEKSKHLGTE